MKTSAGYVQFDLPDGWRNQTSYVFRSRDEELEITLRYSPVGPDATADELMTPIATKLKATGFADNAICGTRQVAGVPAATLITRAQGKGDDEATVMHVATFVPKKGSGATLTATTTARHETKLKAAVEEIFSSMSLVPNS